MIPFFDVRKNEQMFGDHIQSFVNVQDAANWQQDGGLVVVTVVGECVYNLTVISLTQYYTSTVYIVCLGLNVIYISSVSSLV